MVLLPRASQKHFFGQCGKTPIALRFVICLGKKPKCFFLMARTFHGIKALKTRFGTITCACLDTSEKFAKKNSKLNRVQFRMRVVEVARFELASKKRTITPSSCASLFYCLTRVSKQTKYILAIWCYLEKHCTNINTFQPT